MTETTIMMISATMNADLTVETVWSTKKNSVIMRKLGKKQLVLTNADGYKSAETDSEKALKPAMMVLQTDWGAMQLAMDLFLAGFAGEEQPQYQISASSHVQKTTSS